MNKPKPRVRTDQHRALAAARSRAKELLVDAHYDEFREIYDEEVEKAGIRREFLMVKTPVGGWETKP